MRIFLVSPLVATALATATLVLGNCSGGQTSSEQSEERETTEEQAKVETVETTAKNVPTKGETQGLTVGETAYIGQERQMHVTVEKVWRTGEPPNPTTLERLSEGEVFVVANITIENAGSRPFTLYPFGSFQAFEGNGYKRTEANNLASREKERLGMERSAGGLFEPGQRREDLVAFKAREEDELVLRFSPYAQEGLRIETITAPQASWDVGPVADLEGPQTNATDSPQGPSSAEIVQAFQDAGLEVGRSFPVEQEPGWSANPVPKTYKEATRFEIPSMGEDAGGRVFVFESRRDLSNVRDFYENLPEGLRPHLYVEDGVLLQLNNQLPASEARKYRDVLRDSV